MSRSFVGVSLLLVTASVVTCAEPEPAPEPRRVILGQRFAQQGRVDLFVAASAVWKFDADDPRMWEPTLELGRWLIKEADMKRPRHLHNCPSAFRDFAEYRKVCRPKFTRMDVPYFLADPQKAIPRVDNDNEAIQALGVVAPKAICASIIVSRGPVQTEGVIMSSVILANGNVTAGEGLDRSLVICDGDVNVIEGPANKVLVLARGNITVKRHVAGCVLLAGGRVSVGENLKIPDCHNVIKENAVEPLGITFFELSTVGVNVNAEKGAVQVSAITAAKPFAKAGVQVGDTILTVEGNKPDSAESLRRLLRDSLAIGDATVTVRRGDKTETVKVSLPE